MAADQWGRRAGWVTHGAAGHMCVKLTAREEGGMWAQPGGALAPTRVAADSYVRGEGCERSLRRSGTAGLGWRCCVAQGGVAAGARLRHWS